MELIVTTDGGQLIEVHDRASCRAYWKLRGTRSADLVHGGDPVADADDDYACCVHAPSAHPLSREPLRFNNLSGVMWRLCAHGELHPDPDDLKIRFRFDLGVHPCDGCCGGVGLPLPRAVER